MPLSIGAGVYAASRAGRWQDRVISIAGLSLTVVPEFVSSIVLILVIGVWLRWLPISAATRPGSSGWDQLQHLILPALPLVIVLFGYIARMARAMGRKDIADRFDKRAQNWRNSFDVKTGFLRARKANGSFRAPFDPTAINYGSDYTEGNAWQYSWFAPQDQGGLFRLLGGDAASVKKLDAMFDYDNSKLDY